MGRCGECNRTADSQRLTWWQFGQATTVVTGGMEAARRAGLAATASFHICRAELYFALERLADAADELKSALAIIKQPVSAPTIYRAGSAN